MSYRESVQTGWGLAVGVELCKKANGCCFLRCPIQFSTEVFTYMNGIFISNLHKYTIYLWLFEMVIYSNCFSFSSSCSQESLLGDGDAPKTNVEGSD